MTKPIPSIASRLILGDGATEPYIFIFGFGGPSFIIKDNSVFQSIGCNEAYGFSIQLQQKPNASKSKNYTSFEAYLPSQEENLFIYFMLYGDTEFYDGTPTPANWTEYRKTTFPNLI